jgi:integrase
MGVTFAHVAEEWYEHGVHERGWKDSTRRDYRSALNVHLLPPFGAMELETISARTIEAWRTRAIRDEGLPRRTAIKLVAVWHGIFERARKLHALNANPVDDVERHRERYDPSSYDFYTADEIYALARAASSEQDGAIFLVAAFKGLRRGELVALRWRDVDFEGEAIRVERSVDRGVTGTTKSGKGRSVPMVEQVAQALARLGQREHFTGREDLVFPGSAGAHLDASALRRRYVDARKRANLRPIRFHDLRHTFGSLAINRGSIVQVQAWMEHADVDTTMRYLHHKSRRDDAKLLTTAFAVPESLPMGLAA